MSRLKELDLESTGHRGHGLYRKPHGRVAREKGWEVVCPVRDMSNLRHLSGIAVRSVPSSETSSEIARNPGFDYVIHLAG